MHLLLVGISHKTAPVELRERLDFHARGLSDAVRQLARRGVIAGASGAAGLAGALVASADGMLRARLGITPDSQVAVVNTEGATDPASYAAILAG